MKYLRKFIWADMVTHIIVSSIIRLSLIIYGDWHDENFDVPYTDVDYKVFTDAARHVINGTSPYNRTTYRYSPLIAYLLTLNIYFHPVVGKIIFCEFDLIVAYLLRQLVRLNVQDWIQKYDSLLSNKAPQIESGSKNRKKRQSLSDRCAHKAMLCWLYNPLTIAISTRGNSDSLAIFLVVFTLFAIQKEWNSLVVGLVHGFSIHFRIYPIIYSLLFYMYYSNLSYYFNIDKRRKKKKPKVPKFYEYLLPNLNQIKLVLGTLTSIIILTSIFYYKYGYKFLYESLIYHFVRKDFRHNFSLYFYLQYLTAHIKLPHWYTGNLWQPILLNLPPIILIITFSFRYGLNKFSLNFGVLAQTITFVIYNKVITSQYFVWIMGVLPLCLWQIKLSHVTVVVMMAIWGLAQLAWLLPAYLLEFKGEDTFWHIWIQGVSLFCAHVGIFGRLIKNFILPKGELKTYDNWAIIDTFQ